MRELQRVGDFSSKLLRQTSFHATGLDKEEHVGSLEPVIDVPRCVAGSRFWLI